MPPIFSALPPGADSQDGGADSLKLTQSGPTIENKCEGLGRADHSAYLTPFIYVRLSGAHGFSITRRP